LKAPGIKLFKLKCDKLLSNFAVNFNSCRYNMDEFTFFINGAITPLLNITVGYQKLKPPKGSRTASTATAKASASTEVGFIIQKCTFGEFVWELRKLLPTAIPDDMDLASIGAALGAEIDRHVELHGHDTDVSKLGMFDVGSWIKGKLASLPLPRTSVSFMSTSGEWALSIKMEACKLFGMPLELGREMQVHPIKPTLQAPGFKRLKL